MRASQRLCRGEPTGAQLTLAHVVNRHGLRVLEMCRVTQGTCCARCQQEDHWCSEAGGGREEINQTGGKTPSSGPGLDSVLSELDLRVAVERPTAGVSRTRLIFHKI
jgi:hypothetical protein